MLSQQVTPDLIRSVIIQMGVETVHERFVTVLRYKDSMGRFHDNSRERPITVQPNWELVSFGIDVPYACMTVLETLLDIAEGVNALNRLPPIE